jgi:hypothetical protein
MNLECESSRKRFERGFSEGRLIALGDCMPIVDIDHFEFRPAEQCYRFPVRSVKREFGERGLCHGFLDDWSTEARLTKHFNREPVPERFRMIRLSRV